MKVTIAPRTAFSLENPVIAASGTFGYGTESPRGQGGRRLGAIVCKGTTRRARVGNEPVRMEATPAGMLNTIGLQNIGIDALIAHKAPAWARGDVPVLVNISGNSIDDYEYLASRLDGVAGVSGIEVNISCPNVFEGGIIFGAEAGSAGEVTAAVRARTSLPLIVKLSPNVTDIQPIADAVEQSGADAVSLINTVQGMTIDHRLSKPGISTVSGGLSGPAIKPLALYLVYRVAEVTSIPIIGIGGISNATDAIEFLLAGATAVEVGTALLADPGCYRRIISGIERWMKREGIISVDEIVGSANTGFRKRGTTREEMVEMGANRTPRPRS